MTEYDENDDTSAAGLNDTRRTTMADNDDLDTVMAAGTPSGAAGVANAELGTSGAPAENLLTPEELAQTEITGGAGLRSDAISGDQLDGYFGETGAPHDQG